MHATGGHDESRGKERRLFDLANDEMDSSGATDNGIYISDAG